MLGLVRVHPELVTGTQDYELDPSRLVRSIEYGSIKNIIMRTPPLPMNSGGSLMKSMTLWWSVLDCLWILWSPRVRMTCSPTEKLIPPFAPLHSDLPHHPPPSLSLVLAQVLKCSSFRCSHQIILLFTHLPITIVLITFIVVIDAESIISVLSVKLEKNRNKYLKCYTWVKII